MSRSVAKATGLILIINVVVKLLGFVREAVIARAFGTSWIADSYLVAYTIPYFLQSILGFALVAVSVPVLTKYRQQNDEGQVLLVGNSLINSIGISLVVVCILGVAFAPILVDLTAPNLSLEATALSIELTRIMFPSLIFMGIAMVITGILNSGYRFGWAASAQGFTNITVILGVVLFSSTGIRGLAVATLISFIVMLLVQLPSLKKSGFKYRPVLNFKHPAVKGVFKNILPVVLGIAVYQIYLIINRIFASGLDEGSIAALNYAYKLMNLPIGIFVAAVVSAIYPSLSEDAIKKDFKSLDNTLHRGLGLVFLVTIPATIGLIVLREPVVSLLFEGSSFDAESTKVTAYALLYFCIGLVPVSLNMVLTRVYYALSDYRSPVIYGLISVAVNVFASFALIESFTHGGLAFANSIAAFINMLLLYIGLAHKAAIFSPKKMLFSVVKILIASAVMGVCVYFVMSFMDSIGSDTKTWLTIRVFVAIASGCIIYAIAAFLLKINELQEMLREIRGRFVKSH